MIPNVLKEEYLHRLHEGHLSSSKVKANAKEHLYWPGIDETTTSGARNVSKGPDSQRSHSSLMTSQQGHGGKLAWIISTLMALLTF